MTTRRTCTSRIQGNGDSDECGRPVQRDDTCELCLPREIEAARRNAVAAEQAAAMARARLVALVGTADAVPVTACGTVADPTGERGDHVRSPGRTPETVLRSMLAAYQDDRLDIEIAWHELSNGHPLRRRIPTMQRDADIESLRMLISSLITSGIDCTTLREFLRSETRTALSLDFHARLRGDRPLDAPPLYDGGRLTVGLGGA